MIPVLTTEEMTAVDADSSESVEVLIERDAVNNRYEYVVEMLAMPNDGTKLAAATSDGTIRLWTIDTGER